MHALIVHVTRHVINAALARGYQAMVVGLDPFFCSCGRSLTPLEYRLAGRSPSPLCSHSVVTAPTYATLSTPSSTHLAATTQVLMSLWGL